MKRNALLMVALLAGLGALGFNSTKLKFSWMNPHYSGTLQFKNIMVLAINGRATIRAEFEDQLCAALAHPGVQAIPSYSLLPRPDATPIDMNQLRDVVEGQKIDAIVVSRLVKYQKTVTVIPGEAYSPYPYYGTFYGYYAEVYPTVYAPDYLQVEKVAQVETNFYSTAATDGELIWTGTSDTVNPRTPTKGVDALVRVLIEELQRQKIVQ
ncbi:MAG TPA: hypothetical protein VGD60_18865 [Candidatus Acidoferrales bacterium]